MHFSGTGFVNIPGVGSVSRRKLLERFGHPERVYSAEEEEYADILTPGQRARLQESRDVRRIRQSMERLLRFGARFLHWESPDYPSGFRQLFDPPYGIYVRGDYRRKSARYSGWWVPGQRHLTVSGQRSVLRRSFPGRACRSSADWQPVWTRPVTGARWRQTATHWGFSGEALTLMYPRENFSLYMQMYERGGVLSGI